MEPGEIPRRIARKLTAQFGTAVSFSSETNNFICPHATQHDINRAFNEALIEYRKEQLAKEAKRRIVEVVDHDTMIDLMLWYMRATKQDKKAANQLLDWIDEVGKTVKRLVEVEDFSDDRHWPPLPNSAARFIGRFKL